MDDKGTIKGLVVVVLTNVDTGEKRTYETKNIVTDAGDLYYAESGANEAQTNFTTAASEYGTAGNAGAATTVGETVSQLTVGVEG